MKGLQNFLFLVSENYVTILVCFGLIIGIIKKVKNFILMTDQEKIDIAKTQIQETIIKIVNRAELDFGDWSKAGKVKRAEVIDEIYSTYPILNKVLEQEEVIKWIDIQIDNALAELKNVVKK